MFDSLKVHMTNPGKKMPPKEPYPKKVYLALSRDASANEAWEIEEADESKVGAQAALRLSNHQTCGYEFKVAGPYVLPQPPLSRLERAVVKAAMKYRCLVTDHSRKKDHDSCSRLLNACANLELARRKKKGSHA